MTESNNTIFFNGTDKLSLDEYQIEDVSFAPMQMGDIYFYQKETNTI